MGLVLLQACLAALRPQGTVVVEPPSGWAVVRNYRFLSSEFVAFSDGVSRIDIQVVPMDRRSARLPLDLVAEARAMNGARGMGVSNVAWRTDHIVIDGREAWAVTGRRTWMFARADFTLAVVALGRKACLLSLHVPPERGLSALPAWSELLDTIHFRMPADAP